MGEHTPSVGDWLIIRGSYSLYVRQINAITPKLFKLGAGDYYPRQIQRSDESILFSTPDLEEAKRLRDVIAGYDGEYKRRRDAAAKDFNARCSAAQEARDKAIAGHLAKATGAAQ